jgi:diguanylate cyclase (GGDEF)-like protein
VKNLKRTNNIIVSYVAFMMIWGATVSLMDQKIYGQIVVYMVNVIACSVIYYLDNKTVVALYCISAFTLFLGLPFFQQSKAIIIGHCINCAIFLLFSYLASRILYKNLYSDFKSKRLIMETNEKLKNEIEENKMIHRQLEKANKKLKELSLKDELTNLYNRRALREFIDSICSSDFKQKPLSIIMIDIDNFKLYNDKYGHIKGDEVLKKVSGKLNETLRDSINFVARYGGEEFICIFLETDNNEIYEIANKIREKICGLKIAHTYSNVSNYVTISLGMATTIIPYNANLIHQCIKNADIALYKAKNEGKNRIVNYNTIT